jgi:FlaA1/EpsC-like NDP-sugar epimerase
VDNVNPHGSAPGHEQGTPEERGIFNKRRFLVFILDLLFITAAYLLAVLLRFDFDLTEARGDYLWHCLWLILTVKPLVFLRSNLYRSLWRYASLHDAVEIFKTVTLASLASIASLLVFERGSHFSRSIFLMDWILLIGAICASRLLWRTYRETFVIPRMRSSIAGRRTLMVGAGQAGCMLLREIRGMQDSPYDLMGFVDDDPLKRGLRLNGVPVLGGTADLAALVKKYEVEKVIIAIPSAPRGTIRSLIRSCQAAHVQFKTIPGLSEILQGKVSVSQVKDVEIEDLLGREAVALDEAMICSYLTDKTILVSGAAGSIGSEICRQIAGYHPSKLILLDNGETPLYQIERELSGRFPHLLIIPVIADVRRRERIDAVFARFAPQVVFHAAAYKHVPMMEYNPLEAMDNNICGTRVLADAASRSAVRNFVMVSTDKAVNPTNVMGATKRSAELYIQALSAHSKTKFTTVRFGNVLGSNGSVIPLFKEQILKGGPITVTDKEVIRYFMTIPEASQLVLQAGCLGNSGEIFVLDMGEPVRIVELAEELIRLSGFVPYDDIDIVFTGLRPGEKLYEELLVAGEGVKPTVHEKIMRMEALRQDLGKVARNIEEIGRAVADSDEAAGIAALRTLVPEFSPRYLFEGEPPEAFCCVRPDLFPADKEKRAV